NPWPGAKRAGPAWSRKHQGPMRRRCLTGRTRSTLMPPPTCAVREAMRSMGEVSVVMPGAPSQWQGFRGTPSVLERRGRAAMIMPWATGGEAGRRQTRFLGARGTCYMRWFKRIAISGAILVAIAALGVTALALWVDPNHYKQPIADAV